MATTTAQLHPAIQRYLTALEAQFRQLPGIVPEEGLADALEYLQSECEALSCGDVVLSEDDLYRHFTEKFGPPDDVAAEYATLTQPESASDENPIAASSATANSAIPTRLSSRRKGRSFLLATVALILIAAIGASFTWRARLAPLFALGVASRTEKPVWAGRVVSFTPGNPQSGLSADPNASLGPPDCQDTENDTLAFVSLGHGGTLVFEFSDAWLCDRDGPDLKIVEIGPLADPFEVAVSRDGKEWISVGRAKGADSTIDLGGLVRSSDRFRFVRLTDGKGMTLSHNRWPGADIDAVGALHSVPIRQLGSR